MRCTPICVVAILVGASLPAQVKLGESPALPSSSPAALPVQTNLGNSPVVLFASPTSNGCPIGISAERRSPVSMSTVGTAPAGPSTQGIQLRFNHLLAPKIEHVMVVVHGLSQKSRIIPADMANMSDAEETFQLTRGAQATSLTASYIQPKRVFTTQWIELVSVDYADGSTWHASHVAQCTVTPSKLVLVAGR